MNIFKVTTGLSVAATTPSTGYFVGNGFIDNNNRNNVGAVQMVRASGAGAPTVRLEGSVDNTNWVTVASGITTTSAVTVSLYPFMRVAPTTTEASTNIDFYICA